MKNKRKVRPRNANDDKWSVGFRPSKARKKRIKKRFSFILSKSDLFLLLWRFIFFSGKHDCRRKKRWRRDKGRYMEYKGKWDKDRDIKNKGNWDRDRDMENKENWDRDRDIQIKGNETKAETLKKNGDETKTET